MSGDVIEVELEQVDNKVVYEVSIRPQNGGADMEVIVDGVTGAILETAED